MQKGTCTPSLWKPPKSPISFAFVVDSVGVKCVNDQPAKHLIDALQLQHEISTNWAKKLSWT